MNYPLFSSPNTPQLTCFLCLSNSHRNPNVRQEDWFVDWCLCLDVKALPRNCTSPYPHTETANTEITNFPLQISSCERNVVLLCRYAAGEALQSERNLFVSLFNLFFLWPFLAVCWQIPHSAPSRSPTHSYISVFSLCSLLSAHFMRPLTVQNVLLWWHSTTARYTTPVQSHSLSVCSHLPVGRAVHNRAIKSPKNVKHDSVCELSQHLQVE